MSASSTIIPGYEIVKELGQGGMATVFLAIQRSLDRKVALKVMKRNIDDLEKFEKRFLVEGRTMAKLPHRNIVAVYDIVKSEDATYIAMEFLEGGTLSSKMKDGISLADAITVVVQIGAALQFAHEHGVVHRDLKPANIMFRDAHTPVLTDFGIAKQQDQGATRLTQTGMLVGTPTYMSPEQINALEVDGRSDLYSLGIMFYELLTGAPPFSADTPIAVLMAHLTTPPPPLPAHFVDFQPVLDRMLAKNRDDRYANLKEFTRDLKTTVINNQNLFAKLQADPSQSSSEQLRALGFSISGGGDSLQVPASGQIRLPPSARMQRPGGTGQVRTGTMPMEAPPEPKRVPWLPIGLGAAAVIVVGIGVALLMRPSSQLDPAFQKVVDVALTQARNQIAAGELDQARDTFTDALGIEGVETYAGAIALKGELLAAYRTAITAAIDKNDLNTAIARLTAAQLIDQTNPELGALLTRIENAQKSAASAAQIAGLLKRAQDASAAGRDLVAGGAYDLLQQARQLAPEDAKVKQQLDALLAKVLKPANDALARNDFTNAQRLIADVANTLGSEKAVQDLKTRIDGGAQQQAKRVQIDALAAALDEQIRAGRLVAPAGDNAQETLQRARALDDKDPAVVQRVDRLAQALTQAGQSALSAGQTELAVQNAVAALQVKPDFAAAQQLKSSAEGRLDANRRRVLEGLAAAQQAINEGRFVAPAATSAKTLLEGVLELDAANADAQRLLAGLPAQIANSARSAIEAGRLDDADKLIVEARKVYAADTTLTNLAGDVQRRVTEARAREARTNTLTRINQLLATRPVTAPNIGTAAREIANLLAANAQDVDALTARTRLDETLDGLLAAASSTSDIDAVQAALRQAQQSFANDAKLAALQTTLTTNRARIVADEQARLAALQGELVINAFPWAEVVSVVGQDGKAVSLPSDKTTPLRLPLQQGVYTVTLRHPQAPRNARQVAEVKAKQTATANASFGNAIQSKDYLQRAGFN
jgi:tRNA A-37 threonylcarbamoyl transferase component Bud32